MSNRSPQSIQPENLYDFAEAARILNTTPEQFKKNWILTNKIDIVQGGRGRYWILGYALISSLKNFQRRYGDEEIDGEGHSGK